MTVVPFAIIPVAVGSAATLMLVNVFPARRARDLLMLMSLLFAAGLVLMLRFIQPEQLLRVETLPDITDFFATLQSPITPLLPSFWAGEVLFAGLQGGVDLVHGSALWSTALAFTVLLGAAHRGGTSAGTAVRRRRRRRASPSCVSWIASRACSPSRPCAGSSSSRT